MTRQARNDVNSSRCSEASVRRAGRRAHVNARAPFGAKVVRPGGRALERVVSGYAVPNDRGARVSSGDERPFLVDPRVRRRNLRAVAVQRPARVGPSQDRLGGRTDALPAAVADVQFSRGAGDAFDTARDCSPRLLRRIAACPRSGKEPHGIDALALSRNGDGDPTDVHGPARHTFDDQG